MEVEQKEIVTRASLPGATRGLAASRGEVDKLVIMRIGQDRVSRSPGADYEKLVNGRSG
jgi:hypothetical protein